MSSGPTRRNVIAGAAAAVAATAVSDSAAQVAQTGAGLPVPATGGGTAYLGPGDVSTNAAAWYGVKAYNAATASSTNKMMTISDITNSSASIDLFCTTTGSMDMSPLSGITSHIFQVVTWYDQTGNGNHVTQATPAFRPLFLSSAGVNGNPMVGSTAINAAIPTGSGVLQSTTNVSFGPLALYAVTALSCSTGAGFASYCGDNVNGLRFGGRFDTLVVGLQNGLEAVVSVTTAWHAVGDISDASTTIVDVDGGTGRSSFAFGGLGFSSNIIIMSDTHGANWNGQLAEIGIWNRALSDAAFIAMSSNARSSYRYGSF